MTGTKTLSSFFTVRGTDYLMDAGPDVTTLWRIIGGDRQEVATFGAAWDPNVVLCVADIDAQAIGLRAARKVLKQVFGAGIAVLCLLTSAPAWAVPHDIGPPTDKPGPQIPADPPAPHDPAEVCPNNQPECRR